MIDINIEKAKEIHRKNIRAARATKLSQLDIDFQRALEASSDTSEIVAKKQALRDAPTASSIESAVTAADLKTQWDSTLLGESPYFTEQENN
jgi:hypothetical protein